MMAQHAVNRHESTYIDIRVAIVMTTYPVLNAPDNYRNDIFLCISCITTSLGSLPILLIDSTGLSENIN